MAQTFESGKVLEHPQLNNMIRAMGGDGVLSGFAVSQRSAGANMSVDVALGEAKINNTIESESGTTNVVIAAAHATLERKDLITYDASANTPAVIKGTDHAGTTIDPTYPPDIPAGDILLSIVMVDAATTTIADGDITPCQIIVEEGYRYSGSNVFSTNAPTSWTDLDMSSVVGSNRAVVLLKILNNDTSASRRYAFRPNGDTDDYHQGTYDTPTTFTIDTDGAALVTIQTDASGIIEWYASAAIDTDITVMSYRKLVV